MELHSLQRFFSELCTIKGFVRRGNAFFRIHGDGVLQVLKVQKVRYFPSYDIYVGLFSMYDELRPEWFTASGCIPQYVVASFLGSRSAVTTINNETVSQLHTITFEKQIEVLQIQVFPLLENITTQAKLCDAICYFDEITYHGVRWNDSLKFAPFLYSGNYEAAHRVIQSILDQHSFALERNRVSMTPEVFRDYQQRVIEMDQELVKKLKIVADGNHAFISDYLNTNFVSNCIHAQFILRKK